MATAVLSSPDTIALKLIALDAENVRPLDEEHVENLRASIELRGLISPVTLRPKGGRFVLVAGHHRLEACRRLGLSQIPYTLREQEGPSADTAAENILRKDLSPLGEAKAVAHMFAEGYTPEGAAQALGWSPALVTARAKILELPKAAQEQLDSGALPVSTVDLLHEIASRSPALCESIAASVANGTASGAQLANNPSWVVESVVDSSPKSFSAVLGVLHAEDIKALRLGKKTEETFAEANELYLALNRYAYGSVPIRFGELEVDQARAAGVLIEFDHGNPIIVDRPLYRELAKQAILNTREELLAQKEAAESERAERRKKGQEMPSEAQRQKKDHNRTMRELVRQAHGTNLDLGSALLKSLSEVDPGDINVARFFAYGLLGPEPSPYGSRDNIALTLAAGGIRLVFEQHRSGERKKLKGGKLGKEKITYAEAEDAVKWLWKFIDAARTSRELFGRVLIVFAAQHYATQLVLAKSKQTHSSLPSSHNDVAANAFERVTKAVLPASHKNLQKAIAAEAAGYKAAQAKLVQKESRSRSRSGSKEQGAE